MDKDQGMMMATGELEDGELSNSSDIENVPVGGPDPPSALRDGPGGRVDVSSLVGSNELSIVASDRDRRLLNDVGPPRCLIQRPSYSDSEVSSLSDAEDDGGWYLRCPCIGCEYRRRGEGLSSVSSSASSVFAYPSSGPGGLLPIPPTPPSQPPAILPSGAGPGPSQFRAIGSTITIQNPAANANNNPAGFDTRGVGISMNFFGPTNVFLSESNVVTIDMNGRVNTSLPQQQQQFQGRNTAFASPRSLYPAPPHPSPFSYSGNPWPAAPPPSPFNYPGNPWPQNPPHPGHQ